MDWLNYIHFKSERLATANLTQADATALFQIYSDKEAMKYHGSAPMESIEDVYAMITAQLTTHPISKLRLGIRLTANNQLIGTLLLVWNTKTRECEVGFSFGKDHWGNGYGQETLAMMEEKLSAVDRVQTIKAWSNRENQASIRIFEKAGFSVIEQNEHPQSYLFAKRIRHEQE